LVDIKRITFPISGKETASLNVGDQVLISGSIITARDRAHQYLFNEKPLLGTLPFSLKGSLLYHCGPIVKEEQGTKTVVACGPTTSFRVEMYEPWVIEHYGISAIMGKGGMGSKTADALRRTGAVYFHTIGGAAVYLARRVVRVINVWKLEEFGAPEAFWQLEVKDFPAIVTMDASGNSIHERIRTESERVYGNLLGKKSLN